MVGKVFIVEVDDLFAVVVCSGQEFFHLIEVLCVVYALAAGFGVEVLFRLIQGRVKTEELGTAGGHGHQDLGGVDGERQRFTEVRVCCKAFRMVEFHDNRFAGLQNGCRQIAVVIDTVIGGGGQFFRKVELAGLKARNTGFRFGHSLEVDGLVVSDTLATEARRAFITLVLHVVLKSLEDDMHIADPLLQHVGAGADERCIVELNAHMRFCDLLRDHDDALRESEQRGQRQRLFERELDLVITDFLD